MKKQILTGILMGTLALIVGCGQVSQQLSQTETVPEAKATASMADTKVIATNTLTLEIEGDSSTAFTNSTTIPLIVASQSVNIQADVPAFVTFTASSSLNFNVTHLGWIEANGYIQLNVTYNNLVNSLLEKVRVNAYMVNEDGLVGQSIAENIIPLQVEVVNTKPYSDLTTAEQDLKAWLPPYTGAINEIILLKIKGDFTNAINQNFKGTLKLELIIDETDIVPPAMPANFTAQSGDDVVTLNWTNPTDSDFDVVEVRRSTANYPAIDEGTSIYIGNNETLADTTVENGLVYYYSIFAKDENGNVSSANMVTANPVAAQTYDEYTVLMMHMDGTGSNFVDSAKNHIITVSGNASQETQTNRGTFDKAASFSNKYDCVFIEDSSDWNLGSNDFTIEAWVKIDDITQHQIIIEQGTDPYNQWAIHYNKYIGLLFACYKGSDESQYISLRENNVSSWQADTWYHIAVVRNGSSWKIYKDGTDITNTTLGTLTTAGDYSPEQLRIGGRGYSNGNIDEVRISKVARWTSNFTPSTAPY